MITMKQVFGCAGLKTKGEEFKVLERDSILGYCCIGYLYPPLVRVNIGIYIMF